MSGVGTVITTVPPAVMPAVIELDDASGEDAAVVGAKAAALVRARHAGLPVLPGFAVTTRTAARLGLGTASQADVHAVHAAWERVSDGGTRPVVVRSSSVAEDGESSSMAGLFTSVLDVEGWPGFLAAVSKVVDSAGGQPMGVLVQPFIEPEWAGVLFGADPVTGRSDHLVVSAVRGGPEQLVSGQVDGVHYTLSTSGRLREAADRLPSELRRRSSRRRLADLARRAATVFGSPQDVEWALDGDGRPLLLQSRPITAIGTDARVAGPLFGPGPVAETFTGRLRPLEEDLWVIPLRDGLREALAILGTSSRRRLRQSPVVVSIDGRVAADLDLLGIATRRRSLFSRLDPRPPARRLKAAWRVGRLKVALAALADDVIDEVDTDLRSVPDPASLTPAELLHVLRRSYHTLVALHGHEILAGSLLGDQVGPTAAATALRILADERGGADAHLDRVTDAELVARHPVLLSLIPPRIGGGLQLPPPPASPPVTPAGGEAPVRESLRLRVRWVQELTARIAIALGGELVRRGVVASPEAISQLRLDELGTLLQSGAPLARDLGSASVDVGVSTPLPATFRLSEAGAIVPVTDGSRRGGRGAGGGRGSGPVHIGTDVPPSPGDVLVVRTLDPGLAGFLPSLSGLVAETGSVLSHLAILAREYGVPAVVGMAGALERFADGTWVVVDGSTGEVSPVDHSEWRAA